MRLASLSKKSPAAVDAVRAKAGERLSRLTTPEVLNWVDQAGTGIAKAFDDYRKMGDEVSLMEVDSGLASLAGALDVLKSRHALGVGAAPVASVNPLVLQP